jgi:hypothetical protein
MFFHSVVMFKVLLMGMLMYLLSLVSCRELNMQYCVQYANTITHTFNIILSSRVLICI